MPVCNNTERWTREEIIEALTRAAKTRLGMSLEQFVEAVQTGTLDVCEHAEMVALLNLIAKDDTIFVQQPNIEFTEVIELLNAYLEGGKNSPAAFRDFLQKLLNLTVLAEGQSLRLHYGSSPNDFTIAGPKRKTVGNPAEGREFFQPIQLNNQAFLFVIYDCFLNQSSKNRITVRSSKLAYQLDFDGHQQIFRYDHNRVPGNQYPTSHLHVYGKWLHPVNRELSKVHFPTVRFPMESIIRLLIHDFGITSNTTEDIWEPIFTYTEKKFLEIMTKGRAPDVKPLS